MTTSTHISSTMYWSHMHPFLDVIKKWGMTASMKRDGFHFDLAVASEVAKFKMRSSMEGSDEGLLQSFEREIEDVYNEIKERAS